MGIDPLPGFWNLDLSRRAAKTSLNRQLDAQRSIEIKRAFKILLASEAILNKLPRGPPHFSEPPIRQRCHALKSLGEILDVSRVEQETRFSDPDHLRDPANASTDHGFAARVAFQDA